MNKFVPLKVELIVDKPYSSVNRQIKDIKKLIYLLDSNIYTSR